MGIGGSIFLLAVGAILAFAVNAHISGIDINIVGWVLMAAGLVGLIVTIWYWKSRRRTVVSQSCPRSEDQREPPGEAGGGRGVHRAPRAPPPRPAAPAAGVLIAASTPGPS